MYVEIVDKWRNVRIGLTKWPPVEGAPLEAGLSKLLTRQGNANGQLEFECDQEFFDAFSGQAKDNEDTELRDIEGKPWCEGHVAMFRDVPIIVKER